MACFEDLLKHDVKIKIITRPLEGCRSNKRLYMEKVFSEAAQRKIDILFRPNIHQKFAIIDDKLVWYGSINLLSFGKSEESIMRLVSPGIASELINSMEIE